MAFMTRRFCLIIVHALVISGVWTQQLESRRGEIGVRQTFQVVRGRQYVIEYKANDAHVDQPYRIRTWSDDAEVSRPVFVVIRQERHVMSWQLPLLMDATNATMRFNNISRTLCYDTDAVIQSEARFANQTNVAFTGDFFMTLSTISDRVANVVVLVSQVTDFLINLNETYTMRFSASKPRYYVYDLHDMPEEVNTATVRIASSDDICFIASIQPRSCPIEDLNYNVRYFGDYQTISRKGGITIALHKYPAGFFIVFVAKPDNFDCNRTTTVETSSSALIEASPFRETEIVFVLEPGKTADEYKAALWGVFFINLGICVAFVIISVLFYCCGRHRGANQAVGETRPREMTQMEWEDARRALLNRAKLNLSDFTMKGRRNNRKAYNYLWHVSNVAIFYSIPVVQLMVSYQRYVNSSGDLDQCYHNYQCSHPYYFKDFNHFYSNIGYWMFGVLFLLITAFRNWKVHNLPNCGVPRLYGLYYAMGIALILEGVLSACYHICPTQANFQFDTSFMYTLLILVGAKLYQNRHPDINPSAYSTFFVLGVTIIFAMFGILYNDKIVFGIFVIFHYVFCSFIMFKIYYNGEVAHGLAAYLIGLLEMSADTAFEAILPNRIICAIVLVCASTVNSYIAIAGFILYPSVIDFGTYLLIICLVNVGLYKIFYIIMKWANGERVCVEAIFYAVLALACWGYAVPKFLEQITEWSATPAHSRNRNEGCTFMDFYDSHDVWHLASAVAIFVSFMLMLVIDDDQFDKPQNQIAVF